MEKMEGKIPCSTTTKGKWKPHKRTFSMETLSSSRMMTCSGRSWPLGRIVRVYPGPDGLVRAADVHGGGENLRPISKLVHLLREDADHNFPSGGVCLGL